MIIKRKNGTYHITGKDANNFIKALRGDTDEDHLKQIVNKINPEKEYPVSYTINQNGKKVNEPSVILGKDLTENQIIELSKNKLI